MAQQEKIVLWIDRRWKNAIEKHLNGETLQEHMEDVLDDLCNQLPQREYAQISKAIQAESAAAREQEKQRRHGPLTVYSKTVKNGTSKSHPVRNCWMPLKN